MGKVRFIDGIRWILDALGLTLSLITDVVYIIYRFTFACANMAGFPPLMSVNAFFSDVSKQINKFCGNVAIIPDFFYLFQNFRVLNSNDVLVDVVTLERL